MHGTVSTVGCDEEDRPRVCARVQEEGGRKQQFPVALYFFVHGLEASPDGEMQRVRAAIDGLVY